MPWEPFNNVFDWVFPCGILSFDWDFNPTGMMKFSKIKIFWKFKTGKAMRNGCRIYTYRVPPGITLLIFYSSVCSFSVWGLLLAKDRHPHGCTLFERYMPKIVKTVKARRKRFVKLISRPLPPFVSQQTAWQPYRSDIPGRRPSRLYTGIRVNIKFTVFILHSQIIQTKTHSPTGLCIYLLIEYFVTSDDIKVANI